MGIQINGQTDRISAVDGSFGIQDLAELNISGIVTAASANFTGNVSIGGTLTYQDVTNIDSVGVITARAGVHVTGGNVGINETNPSGKLEVKAVGATAVFNSGAANDGRLEFEYNSSRVGLLAYHSDRLEIQTDSGKDFTIRTNGANERLRIDSSGNLTAVNTSSGGATTLKVGANATSGVNNGTIIINNGGTGDGALQFDYENSAARAKIYVYRSNQELRFDTAGSERLRINSAGEVYIGSTTANGQGKLFVNDSSGTTTTRVHIRNAVSTGNAETYYNLDGTKFASVGLENGSLVFRNGTSSTPTERLRVKSDGKVGIGTDNVDYKLEVFGAPGADGDFSIKSAASAAGGTAHSKLRFRVRNPSNQESTKASIHVESAANWGGNLIFGTKTSSGGLSESTVERLRITSNGNIGIGTDDPDHNLHVNRSGGDSVITIESTGNGNDSALEFKRTSSSGDSKGAGSIYVTGDTSASEARMHFGVGHNISHGSSPRMTIMGNGEVGIGTINAGAPLHVFGSSDVSSLIDAAAGDGLLTIRNAGDGNWSGINFTRERSTGTNVTGGSIWMPSDTSNNSALLYIQTQSASANAGVANALTTGNGVRIKLSSQPSGVGTHSSFSVEVGDEQRFEIKNSGQIGLGNTGFGGLNNQTIISNGGSAAATWGGVNQYAFYGEQDTQQTVATATYTHLVNFATNTITSGSSLLGIFNEAGGRFTVGIHGAGLYYLTMTVGIDDVQANDYVQCAIAKNGTNQAWDSSTRLSSYGRSWNSGGANSIVVATVSCISYLNAGDVVSFYVYHNEGSSEPTEPNRTSVMGFRLST